MPDDITDTVFELARRYGTPLLVVVEPRLQAAAKRIRAFAAGLPLPAEIFYSYKTNYLPTICERLAQAGIGAEVTSAIEWGLATRLHTPPAIVVNGIGKQAGGFLAEAIAGAPPRLVNLETDTEVDLVSSLPARDDPIRIGLRVNVPGLSGERGNDRSEHWRRGTAKFGWSAEGDQIVRAAQQVATSPGAALEALHVHVGSQVVSSRVYETVLRSAGALLERLRGAGVTSVTTLDLGGGLASGWVTKTRSGPLFELLNLVGIPIASRAQREPDLPGITAVFERHLVTLRSQGISDLVLEPGRFLAEPAMIAVATVTATRRDGDRRHAVLDIGTNALHCWRGNEQRPVTFDGAGDRAGVRWELVGPLCHRSDTFGRVTAPADLAPGTLVTLDAIGAYSVGDWIANTWHRPAICDQDGRLLWRRQDTTEFFAPALDVPAPTDG
jgi:diaminopimelate decarboxylase